MNKPIIVRTSLEEALRDPLTRLVNLFGEQVGQALFGAAAGEDPAGMLARADLLDTVPGNRGLTIDGQSVSEIWEDMQALLAAFNASNDLIVSLLSFTTVKSAEKVGVPTNPGFQIATELGRPSKVRMTQVTRGFPLEHFDLGDGYTQEYIDSATGEQIMAIEATILNSWTSLERDIVMEAMFNDTNTTDQDAIVVKRLYNADGEVPPAIKRWTHDGTHTHYLFNGGAGFTQANLDTMSEHLIHHGFREFGDANFLLFAHRDDLATIRAMANFISSDEATQPTILGESGVLAGLRRRDGTGNLQVEGWVNDWTIIQLNDMPTGYLFGMITGGPLDKRNIVGLRQHENTSIRGLRLVEGNRQNYPLYDSVFDGYMGAGVAQRGAGVIMQDAASYTVPTFATGE